VGRLCRLQHDETRVRGRGQRGRVVENPDRWHASPAYLPRSLEGSRKGLLEETRARGRHNGEGVAIGPALLPRRRGASQAAQGRLDAHPGARVAGFACIRGVKKASSRRACRGGSNCEPTPGRAASPRRNQRVVPRSTKEYR
jgi:hypothetical protein